MLNRFIPEFPPGRSVATMLLAILPLAACTVGPDFKQSAPPVSTAYTATRLPAQTSTTNILHGNAQRFVAGQAVPANWWQNFGSPKLDALVEQALKSSPTLFSAQATLLQAQQTYAAQAGATLYPKIDATVGAQRELFNTAAFGLPGGNYLFNLYNVGVAVNYNFDLFGGNRRTLEAYAAQADYQRYLMEASKLTLAANVATAAMTQAEYAAQLQASKDILVLQQQQLSIAQQRLKLGAVARSDTLALQTQVEQTRAGIPPLLYRLQQTNHLLALLTGQETGNAVIPQFALSDFTLPSDLPVVVPSELVRQRPDIQASEALLHVANAQYGAAVATAYPNIGLSANVGSESLTTAGLFSPASMIWGIAGQIAQPLFNGGLQAGIQSVKTGYAIAAANYRQTVLLALRNVADVLRALDNDAQTLSAQSAADSAAQASLALMRQQYALGGVNYLQLLSAQQQAQQTRINLIAAQTQRLTDTAALYQAMGGGLHDQAAPAGKPAAALPAQ
ncbi:MAG TPA: efflux transporter outer membrane subunit [Burkholderiales bacterium]|nr:efflux transporter outer membrane subunit [Burkholderiales bacterium]